MSLTQQQPIKTESDCMTLNSAVVGNHRNEPFLEVGRDGHSHIAPMTDAELRRHIADAHFLMQLANARFRGSKAPQDAAEAQMWSRAKDQAQAALLQARRARQRDDELTMGGEWATKEMGA